MDGANNTRNIACLSDEVLFTYTRAQSSSKLSYQGDKRD